jgi:hypothetical protein
MSKSHGIKGPIFLAEGDVYKQTSYKMHDYGAVGMAENGDLYRYARLAADVSAGYLLVSLGREANHQNVALSAAAAVGDTKVIPTVGATAVDANEYDEGWLIFNDVSPEGEAYKIVSHEANVGSLATDINLDRPLLAAATTSSEVTLVRNPWNKPAVSQLIAERPAGVTMTDWDVSEACYGWLKTRGMASTLVDSTGATVGYKVTISDQTNGAVGLFSDVDGEPEVGWAMATHTATEFNPTYLTID